MGRNLLSIEEYREQLEERLGPKFIEDMDSVFSGDITLSQIARKNKITKMRASQFFKRLYGRTFREARAAGFAKDDSGNLFSFEPGKSKQFMVMLPEELHTKVKEYSESVGLSMAVIIRDCINDFFSKDGLTKLSKIFK